MGINKINYFYSFIIYRDKRAESNMLFIVIFFVTTITLSVATMTLCRPQEIVKVHITGSRAACFHGPYVE